MIKTSVSLDVAIDFLNELVILDREAMETLFNMAVSCSKEFANHYAVQCRKLGLGEDWYAVSILGVLNGLFGTDENKLGSIVSVWERGNLIKFVKRENFFGQADEKYK